MFCGDFFGFFLFVLTKFCLFRLFQYRYETPKQTEKKCFLVSRNKPKTTETDWVSFCFGANQKKKFDCFKDTLVSTTIIFNPSSHGPFFPHLSRSQVALNLAAQVTCDLAVRRRTPSLLPPPQLSQGPRHGLFCHDKFNIVSVACQVSN